MMFHLALETRRSFVPRFRVVSLHWPAYWRLERVFRLLLSLATFLCLEPLGAQQASDDTPSVPLRHFSGSATPIEFEIYDARTDRMERGLPYLAQMAGKLVFENEELETDWIDPTLPLQFRRGTQLAVTSDPDLDAEIAASRGQLAPMWADVRIMLNARRNQPSIISRFELVLKEGEALLLEASILEREMERTLRGTVVSPADAEIIEGTRQSVNINPLKEVLFRYYPLSHFRFQIRIPVNSWGPDWPLRLEINEEPAQILKIYSVDLDETNEQWILGIECKPSTPLRSMKDRFDFQLELSAPSRKTLGQDLQWHRPSSAIVGRRRSYNLTAPKISGLLQFTKSESSWVESGEQVGEATMDGMSRLVERLNNYRTRAKQIIDEVKQGLLPDNLISENNTQLIRLQKYHARAGALVERASAMRIEAKVSGLLIGTLDYQGPVTSESLRIPARIISPYVEVPDVLLPKAVDVQDDDIVRIELPSGGHRWGKVFQVTRETLGPIQDLQTVQKLSVLVYSPDFQVGEESQKESRDPRDATLESGMPVYVETAKYQNKAERDRIQANLKAQFHKHTLTSGSDEQRYPILFRFRSSTLSPLEKMAYMQQSRFALEGKTQRPSYVSLLTEAIMREQNPETRWIAFRRLAGQKFVADFEPFATIAAEGDSDVACAALFHLYKKRRPFELLTVLQALQTGDKQMSMPASHMSSHSRKHLCYQLLRAMLDFHDPLSDALTLFVKQGRADPEFREQMLDLFEAIIRTEGVNTPAAIRILRGTDSAGQPFFTETELGAAIARTAKSREASIRRVFERELARRKLLGISLNSRYGYAATFIESGFLYLRDLEKIDLLVRSRENYLQDQLFLESSPNWTRFFKLDPRVIQEYLKSSDLPEPIENNASSSFSTDVECTNFRNLTKQERAGWIEELGTQKDFVTLVLLLRDAFVRETNAGDILDWLLLTPESRLELARYYSTCQDGVLLDLIDRRRFGVEVLADIDSAIRAQEQASMLPSGEGSRNSAVLSPATVQIYQKVLESLAARDADAEKLNRYKVAWFGLLPSAFELDSVASPIGEDATASTWPETLTTTGKSAADATQQPVRYVRQRRALRHAISREREKRAENPNVEIQPGAEEETVLRKTLEQVEAGMPVDTPPLRLLKREISSRELESSARMALNDTVRLALLRDQEFSSGKHVQLNASDIGSYVAKIVFAPFYLMLLLPVVWLCRGLMLVRSFRVTKGKRFTRDLSRAASLLRSLDSPFKKQLIGWIEFLEVEPLNLEHLVSVQERLKRIMNSEGLVFRVDESRVLPGSANEGTHADTRDSLHPESLLKLAPLLTLLSLLCRLTAERIVQKAENQVDDKRELYFLMEWFAQRSSYFSGYRYTLDPLANYQIAETYRWHQIPKIDPRELSFASRLLAAPCNLVIGLINLSGQFFLTVPVRYLYLFAPVSILGATVFRSGLKRLVLLPGNKLEESLYPNPDDILRRTRIRLKTGRTSQAIDQPGGRLLFSLRRIATRLLPFFAITVVICGGLPLIVNSFAPEATSSAWNTRSPGVYVALAAVFLLTITMVLHWLPLLSGWLPFKHFQNQIAIHSLRRFAQRKLLPFSARREAKDLSADGEMRRLNLECALKALRSEQETDKPVLDAIVLMVENPNMLKQFRRLARSLVNKRTAVLAFVTSESMDGGGARLSTLKTIQETYPQLRRQHPCLPPKLEETRFYFMPLGADCDPTTPLPFDVSPPTYHIDKERSPLTPFVMAIANVQAFMRSSFVDRHDNSGERFVGSITASPQRLYVGPHNVDQGGRFRGGITLVGAFESIESAGKQGSLVLMGQKAFIRSSTNHLKRIIRKDAELNQFLDADNTAKRQLSVAQVVIERFRTPERHARHITMCIRYIEEIQEIRNNLINMGRQSIYDVTDEEFLNGAAIHYMRHLIVPWFIAFREGSMEAYRSAVLTSGLEVRDRRRMFHQRVLELIEVFQAEGQQARRRLPKIRFVSAPSARIFYGKTAQDINKLYDAPQILFPDAEQPIYSRLEGVF